MLKRINFNYQNKTLEKNGLYLIISKNIVVLKKKEKKFLFFYVNNF